MSLHTELTVDISVYGETTKATCKFNQDFSDFILDTLVKESSARIALAAQASDIAFGMNGITNGQLILLKSDDEFTVKINGTGETALTLKPQTNSSTSIVTPAFLAMLADGITSLHFANPSTTAAIEIDVGIAGDA